MGHSRGSGERFVQENDSDLPNASQFPRQLLPFQVHLILYPPFTSEAGLSRQGIWLCMGVGGGRIPGKGGTSSRERLELDV